MNKWVLFEFNFVTPRWVNMELINIRFNPYFQGLTRMGICFDFIILGYGVDLWIGIR